MAKKNPAKKLGKKDLQKTKGGILIGLNQPTFKAPAPPAPLGSQERLIGIDFRP